MDNNRKQFVREVMALLPSIEDDCDRSLMELTCSQLHDQGWTKFEARDFCLTFQEVDPSLHEGYAFAMRDRIKLAVKERLERGRGR